MAARVNIFLTVKSSVAYIEHVGVAAFYCYDTGMAIVSSLVRNLT